MQGFGSDVIHINIADEDILDYTAASPAAFEPQPDVCTQKLTIGYQDVFNPTGHLATDNETTVTFKHRTIVDNDIFCRAVALPTIFVLTGFNTYPIVPYVKCTVDDNCIFTRLQIQSVAVLCVRRVSYLHPVQDHIFTH